VRDGLMGVLEFRPSKDWTSTLDLYASKFKQENTANQLEFKMDAQPEMGAAFPAGSYASFAQNANNVQTGGAFTGAYPMVRGMYGSTQDTINAFGWSNKFKLAGVSMLADVSYSKAVRDEVSLETNTSLRTSGGSLVPDNVNLNWGNGAPAIALGRDYSDPAKLILGNTAYDTGYGKLPHVEDELKGLKLVATLTVPSALEGYFSGADVGLNYAKRAKSYSRSQDVILLAPGVGANQTISSDLLYGPVNLGFAGTGTIPSWNVPGVVAKYMTFNPTTDSDLWKAGNVWEVDEKITTSFAKANIETELGGMSLRGNMGVQVQNTDQASTSRVADNTVNLLKPFTDGKTYSDVLPSMNLAFLLPNDQTVRLAAAKQLARPRVDQMKAALNFSVDLVTGKPSGSGGNPQLDPWRATAYDVSYEKYFGKKGYVAAAAFYKDLKSYIYELTQDNHDFSKLTQGIPYATTPLGTYTAPFNGQNGSLRGYEFSASVPLNLLNPSLDGFGVTASTSITDSGIVIQDPSSQIGANIPLPGLSKNVSNLTVYYEKSGFSARVSQRRRSDFVGEITTYDGTRVLKYVVGESIVDLQLGYNFSEGSLKGLGLVFQVNNLNDAAYQTYSGTPDKPLDYIKYGRTVLFGANYKF
jgi:TonB-dependent receptor